MAIYRYATKELSINNAEAFVHACSMQAGTSSDEDTSTSKHSTILYVAIGRTVDWDSEPSPNEVQDNDAFLRYQIHRNFIGAKKVTADDICHVTTRHDWSSGTVYSMYRHTDTDMYERPWYVLTEDYNVYVCLFNNKGAASTIKPTGFSTIPFTTSDGYTWKYMYTISLGDANKFLTTSYMPVRRLTSSNSTTEQDRQIAVQNAAVNGSIEIVETVNVGSGYPYVANGAVEEGGALTLRLSTSSTTGASAVDNFYNGSSVYVLSGTGAGQLRRVIDYDGSRRILTVNTAFATTCNTDSRVVISPTCTIVGDGYGAKAYCSVDTAVNSLSEITVIESGQNYSTARALITSNSVHGTGGTANAIISSSGGHGGNPIRELSADKVMINVQLDNNMGVSLSGKGYTPSNTEFRTVALFKDPMLKVDSNNDIISTETVANTSNSPTHLRLTSKMKFSYDQMDGVNPINPLSVNDVITNKRVRDKALDGTLEFVTELTQAERTAAAQQNALRAANATITYIRDAEDESDASIYSIYINSVESYANYKAFEVNDVVLKSQDATEIGSILELSGPEANTFSGEVLYVENIQPVLRDPDQIEDIKIILDF